MMILKLKF